MTARPSFAATLLQASYQRPLLLLFGAPWYEGARRLTMVGQQMAQHYRARLAVIELDTYTHSAVFDLFNVKTIPAIMMLLESEIIYRREGDPSLAELTEVVAHLMETQPPLAE